MCRWLMRALGCWGVSGWGAPWVAVAVGGVGCAPVTQAVSIAVPRLPSRFELSQAGGEAAAPEAGSGANAEDLAPLPWSEYFGDPRLVELIREGLRASPDLAVALERVERARSSLTEASGALSPRVDAGLGVGVRKFGLYTMDGAGNATTDITPGTRIPVHLTEIAPGVQASWEVDLWGRLRATRDAARTRLLASQEGAHLVRSALVADIASAWFELLALDHARAALAHTAATQADAARVARLQREAGRASALGAQQLDALVAETRALEVEASQRAREVEARLNVLLGRFPQTVARPASALSFEPLPALSTASPAAQLRNRPDVRQAELEIEAARLDREAALAALFPSLSLGASVGLQAFSPAYLLRLPESLAYSLLGGVAGPLLNRDALEAQLQGATAAQREALYAYQRVLLVSFAEVSTSLAALRACEELVTHRRAQRRALDRSVETAQMLFGAGRASYLEVLAAQQSALRAELDVVEAWRRQRVAAVALYRALGGGWREGEGAGR